MSKDKVLQLQRAEPVSREQRIHNLIHNQDFYDQFIVDSSVANPARRRWLLSLSETQAFSNYHDFAVAGVQVLSEFNQHADHRDPGSDTDASESTGGITEETSSDEAAEGAELSEEEGTV